MAETTPQPAVLVLDDEATVRESMRIFLKEYGYEPIEAETVERAVEVLCTTPITAVILDVHLAGDRSGLEVLTALRQQPELTRVPVLILTGGSLSDADEAFITRKRAHLFYKPEGYDTLLNFLDQLTGRDRTH